MTKSAHTRASLLPYPIIAAAVAGDAEAVSRVVRHYSSYIAALSTRTSYGSDGYPRLQVDEELRNRLEAKLIIATVYKGNIIKNLIMDCQSYTKYRPNETTGGIFVSWRRKEELPTGA